MAKISIQQIQKIESEMLKEAIDILGRNNIPFYMCCGSVLGAVRHNGPIPWDTDMDVLIPLPFLEKARNCLDAELSERFCIDDLRKNKGYKNMFPRIALPNTSSDILHVDLFPLMGLPDKEEDQHAICDELGKRQKVIIKYKHFRQNIVHPSFIKNAIGLMIEIFCSPYSKKKLTDQYYKVINEYPYDSAKYVMNACGHYGKKNIFEKEIFGKPVMHAYDGYEVPLPEQWDFYLRRYYKEYMELPPENERLPWMSFELHIDDKDYEAIKDIF